jgi:hypothetical protein
MRKYSDENHAIPIQFIQSTKCQKSLKWQLPIEKRKINKQVISVLSVLFITTYNSVNNQIDLQVQNPIIKVWSVIYIFCNLWSGYYV